jgi:hypothetical protein
MGDKFSPWQELQSLVQVIFAQPEVWNLDGHSVSHSQRGGARGRETNGRIVWLPIRPPRPLCFVARPTRQGRSSLAFPPATGRVQSQTSTTCAFRRNSARGLGLAGLFLSLSSAAEHRAGRRIRDWAIGSRHHCGWSVMARAAFSSSSSWCRCRLSLQVSSSFLGEKSGGAALRIRPSLSACRSHPAFSPLLLGCALL